MKNTLLLLAIVLNLCCFGQESYKLIFQDNFESGEAANWNLADGWDLIEFEGNKVLECKTNTVAIPIIKSAILDFKFHIDIYSQSGSYDIWLRHREIDGENSYGYYLNSEDGNISLIKRSITEELILGSSYIGENKNEWISFLFELNENVIKVFVNDELKFNILDNNPILSGRTPFRLHNHPDSHNFYDNVEVWENPSQLIENEWISTGGPWGGIGYDVRFNPNNPEVMYVTDTWSGNHKSINGGNSWYQNNSGIQSLFGSTAESIPIFCLVIDPNNVKNVWCGTKGVKGIYRSTDEGENWEKKIDGIPNFENGINFRGLAVKPGNSNIVFSAAEIPASASQLPEGKEFGSGGKVFKSTDFGETWREVLNSDALVRHILINPDNPEIMYVSTGIFDVDCISEEGVFKSIDGGETWFNINNGLTDLTVAGLHIDNNNSNTLWACTGRDIQFGGDGKGKIFKSINAGSSWQQVFPDENSSVGYISSITTSGSNSEVVYAAAEQIFYVSIDGGQNWETKDCKVDGVYTGIPVGIAAHPFDENSVLINSYSGGIFRTDDYGDTWKAYNSGYSGAEMRDIWVDPTDPLKVITIARSGNAKTKNGGLSWEGAGEMKVGETGMILTLHPIGEQNVLANNHLNPNSLLCGADYSNFLLKTVDQNTWEVIFNTESVGIESGHGIGDMEFSYSDSNIVYFGIRYSTLPYNIDRPFYYDPNIVSSGMFKSLDGGFNWESINNGLEGTTKNIQVITVNPKDQNTVYAGVYGFGIYKTTDGGQHWMEVNSNIQTYSVASIAINPHDTSIVYIGVENGGMYKTINGGENWHQINLGMDPEASIRSISIDPINSNKIYAADWRSGVYYSVNGGERWYTLNKGLSTRSVQKLAISNDGQHLYAATQGAGVFHLTFAQMPPYVQYKFPEENIFKIEQNDSIEFIVNALDFNGDSLAYLWYLNGNLIENSIDPTYLFHTEGLSIGNYSITCEISDGISLETVFWNMTIDVPVGINSKELNNKIVLNNVYPNPFTDKIYIDYSIPMTTRILIEVYNQNGIKMETLINQKMDAGTYKIDFLSKNYLPGIHYIKIKTNDTQIVKSVLLLKH